MMVLFVSECEKAAWKRSRRILSRYAVQIGRRTWLARMSAEGLKNIRQALTQAASRHTAVACHRIKGRYRTDLAWVVGTRRHFSTSGEFAFSHSAIPLPKVNEDRPPAIRLVTHLCILAGLFHDLGKHGACFQRKLRDETCNQSDPVRHERLSLLLLLRLIILICPTTREDHHLSTPSGPRQRAPNTNHSIKNNLANLTDNQWLTSLTDSDRIYQALQQLWNENPNDWKDLHPMEGVLRPVWGSAIEDQGLPLLLSVLCFLIISHHKLPDGHENNFVPLEKTYLNKPDRLSEGLTLATKYSATWQQSPVWIAEIIKHARRSSHLLQEHSVSLHLQDYPLWYSTARYMARCALVLADHKVSSQAKQEAPISPQSDQDKTCFANSYQGQLRQTLADHLIQVGKLSGRAFNHLHQLHHGHKASGIEATPAALRASITEESYIWQEVAEQKLLQWQKQTSAACAGFFALVMAETGSGKTRGNARILAAANQHQNYRLTVTLGLRTLTLQTGDEYQRDLGFGNTPDTAEELCAVIVGGALTTALHEITNSEESKLTSIDISQQREQEGAESSHLEDFFYEGIAGEFGYDPDSPWPEDLVAPNNPKLNRLLQIPVLICTIDHLMPFIQSQRASAAVLGFRLAGSDLIIDEIDSFSMQDLPALLKLAYVVGFNGRKLLLSSATLPPAIARSFYQAYQTGFHRWQQLQGVAPGAILCGWFSHHSQHIKLTTTTDNTAFAKQHKQFITDLLETLHQQPVRRRLDKHLIPIVDNKETTYKNIMQSCYELHQQWANQDPTTGVYYSIGCVRWSNVIHTRGFAEHWLKHSFNLDDKTQLKLICYHAKHLPLIRNHMESVLDTLLKRKGEAPHNHSSLRTHLKDCQQQGKTQLLVVVSTSPIAEVGRDHDYDWGIVEPNSYWSLIQMAGRIWRHRRNLQAHQPNMKMMAQTMRGLAQKPMRFTQPGPESKEFLLCSDKATDLAQIFDLTGLQQRIDSRFTLAEPLDEIKKPDCYPNMHQLEQGQLQILLENNEKEKRPMYFIKGLDPQMLLSQKHSQCCPFREGINQNLLWFDLEDETWKYLENGNKKTRGKNSQKVKDITKQVKETNYRQLDQSYFKPEVLNRSFLYDQWQEKLAQRGLDKFHVLNQLPLSIGDTFEGGKNLEYNDLIGYLFTT